MMTLMAYFICTAASDASAGFIVPVTSPPPASVSPKLVNRMLASERFIARAISSVSSVPADPTSTPAMIIAGFCSTKPSRPTAIPVKALYSEITTGMSAPPIGIVIRMPKASAPMKKSVILKGVSHARIDSPMATVATSTTPLTIFWPENRIDRFILPSSLAHAIRLPANDTPPISAPSSARPCWK